MKLTYQTGVAALIQFITLTLLGIPNTIVSIISTCHGDGTDCVSNSIVSLIFFLLTAVWFGIVWMVAYLAQERRSKRLAWLLIVAELGTLLVAAHFNLPHDTNFLTKATSILDILLSLWIIVLAFRLSRAKGGRIVSSGRARKRRTRDFPGPEL